MIDVLIYCFHLKGCFYHGCDKCFDKDTKNHLKGVTMATLRKKTEQSSMKLREQGFNVIEMWEHEFLQLKKTNEELKEFLKKHSVKDRLNPRDAFFGGRTNATRLFYQGTAKYIDFTSLYPWVNIKYLYVLLQSLTILVTRLLSLFFLPR